MGASLKSIVGVIVSFLLLAILFPIAMTEVTGANTTAWETAVTTIFTLLLPILVIVGLAVRYVKSR